jgi:hypothetical protein
MKTPLWVFFCFACFLLWVIADACNRDDCQKRGDYSTLERIANAAWSSDDSQIFRNVSVYETRNHDASGDWDPCGRNWQSRFEICNADMSVCRIVGTFPDNDMGWGLHGRILYWIPSVGKIITNQYVADNGMNDSGVMIDTSGDMQVLKLPEGIRKDLFSDIPAAGDIAPSPNEDVVAVYFSEGSSYFLDLIQCISFFDIHSGQHISTIRIPLDGEVLLNSVENNNNRRCNFLWSKDGSGVFIVRRDQSFFIKYGNNAGITSVDSVPERGTITNSGFVSNSGLFLEVNTFINPSAVEIRKVDDWIPFDSLELIPKEQNTYSFF